MIRLSENGINRNNRHERVTPVPVFLRSRSGVRLKRKNAVLVILPLPVDYTAPKVLICKGFGLLVCLIWGLLQKRKICDKIMSI